MVFVMMIGSTGEVIMRLILFLISTIFTGMSAAESYSAPLHQDYRDNVYWGDTYAHTYLSPDVYTMGSRVTPDEA